MTAAPPRQPRRACDYAFGAQPIAPDRLRFRIWAPGVERMELELDGGPPMAMHPRGEGFHELICPGRAGMRYRYRLPDGRRVPDPASRMQDGDVHDASVVVDTRAFSWKHASWAGRPWTEAVLYEIHCGLAGGFAGVRARLRELAALGVTAVELMPVADFPGPRNWGYDGVLPYAPDRAYGTPEDLKHLVDEAHGLGLMVFLDVVYNHFGPDGNYLPAYAPDFFREDVHTPWGAAIDFRRPAVRRFFAENALYWLREYRFDGLRLDAVHAIGERDWLPEMARFVRERVPAGRQVHLVLENDDNEASLLSQGFDAQWNDDAHHVLHHILTGERQGYYAAYAGRPGRDLARALAEGFVYQGERPRGRDAPRGEPSAHLAPSSFVFFLQNHDQVGNRAFGERLASLCDADPDALRAAIALQLLTPHIPLLFMGEEYGARDPFLYFTSHGDAGLAKAVREGRRAEFAHFPAFADPLQRARIPDPNDPDTFERSRPSIGGKDGDAARWHAWYRELLALRRRVVAPCLDGARSAGAGVLGPLAVRAEWILAGGRRLAVYCNFSGQDLACPGLASPPWSLLFHSRRDPQSDDDLGKGRLPARCTAAAMAPGGRAGGAAAAGMASGAIACGKEET